ncbi:MULTISPECIES: hypothetical protein [Actinomadura]|uniref:DUF222 domain-containing protein n=1 Tax=Actinomadura yumaensis TaxID=111807 RepID=A0ABW2CBF5_9ACTN|nr:hypothetical protein [Actinomadura sp. J1-007]MWK33770.1 hypothetical protein [Actinomadura sp. J1-007]
MGSTSSARTVPPAAARRVDREPAALAMRIGVVAAEAALATFARNLDLDDLEDGGVDFQGAIGPAEWPVFSLVIDTLAEADRGDGRTLDERRADALNDLARICMAAKERVVA